MYCFIFMPGSKGRGVCSSRISLVEKQEITTIYLHYYVFSVHKWACSECACYISTCPTAELYCKGRKRSSGGGQEFSLCPDVCSFIGRQSQTTDMSPIHIFKHLLHFFFVYKERLTHINAHQEKGFIKFTWKTKKTKKQLTYFAKYPVVYLYL